MTRDSWVDTVWRMGGTRVPVYACIRAVDGEDLTFSVVGPAGRHPRGAEILPGTGKRRCARIPVAALLQHWTMVDGVQASVFRGRTRRLRVETD
jgi:hypothetical protein